jgi:hypothetical protein
MTRATPARPIFVLHLRPKPGIDPIRALRAALKVLGRRFGFTVISAAAASRMSGRHRQTSRRKQKARRHDSG